MFFAGVVCDRVCGYLRAMLATFFLSQDAESDRAEIAATQSIQGVETENSTANRGSSLLY
ncbi:hypothetical protein [Microcoleus sp. B7-D4]|uniref:hypothetical protein n=1 Tax=Microcoleus sp. B7-D4 TaxID=2818696 RepID=UPI002FD29CD3